jgi:hypothetical protein
MRPSVREGGTPGDGQDGRRPRNQGARGRVRFRTGGLSEAALEDTQS